MKNSPIPYCVFVQNNQEKEINAMNDFHYKSEGKIDDLRKILFAFVQKNRQNESIVDLFYMENLLDSVEQFEYSFSKIKKIEKKFNDGKTNDCESLSKKKSSYVLVFFYNAFSFMKIVENYTNIQKNTSFNQLIADITKIRDCFAHSYKKDICVDGSNSNFKSVVALQKQLGVSLDFLMLTDSKTGSFVGSIQFSIPLIYFSLRDIFKQLIDNPDLLIKK